MFLSPLSLPGFYLISLPAFPSLSFHPNSFVKIDRPDIKTTDPLLCPLNGSEANFDMRWLSYSSSPSKDPHDELKGQNVLIVGGSDQETAAKFGLSLDLFRQGVLKAALSAMKTARARRPPPHLDDKMLTAWNGAFYFCNQNLEARQNNKKIMRRSDDFRPGQSRRHPKGPRLRGTSPASGGICPKEPLRRDEWEAYAQLLPRNGRERVADVNRAQ